MRHSISKDLYAYWNALRGARAAPDRSDIDPGEIRHLLADSFILEVDSACRFPVRLSGTRLNALQLCEQKGVSFLDMWRKDDRRDVAAALLTVIDGATPIVGGAKARPPSEFANSEPSSRDMDFELLLLPLRHFGRTHSRLIGSLAAFGQASWFGRAAAPGLELVSLRMIQPHEQERLRRSSSGAHHSRWGVASPPRLIVYEGGKSRF